MFATQFTQLFPVFFGLASAATVMSLLIIPLEKSGVLGSIPTKINDVILFIAGMCFIFSAMALLVGNIF
jgi:uncharacterized membrane protein